MINFKTILRAVKKKIIKKKSKKKSKSYRRVVQGHHITYDPDWIVKLYKGEHWVLTLISWRTHVSKGFITAIKEFLRKHEHRAIDLGGEVKHCPQCKKPMIKDAIGWGCKDHGCEGMEGIDVIE